MTEHAVVDSSLVARLPHPGTAVRALDAARGARPVLDGVVEAVALAQPGIVPVISLVTREAQVFAGLPRQFRAHLPEQVPLAQSFCKHVVAGGSDLVVHDATVEPPACHRAAVLEIGVQAYLGTPLVDEAGRPVGAACLVSFEAVAWDVLDIALVHELARTARAALDLGRVAPVTPRAATRPLAGLGTALVPRIA